MGYRSEVAFIVPDTAPKFEEIDDCFDSIIEKDGYRLYHATWLKWYEDFPIVQAVNEYLATLDENETEKRYLFIRIGEDAADVDEEGNFWDNPFDMGWVRKIEFSE